MRNSTYNPTKKVGLYVLLRDNFLKDERRSWDGLNDRSITDKLYKIMLI